MTPPPERPRIHVCHLIKGLGRGGAEGLLPQVIRAGDDQHFIHSVGYFLPWKDALADDLRTAGAEVHCFGVQRRAGLPAAIPATTRWLRQQGADVVHAHLPLSGVIARLAGRMAGVPVVYTEHNLQPRYHPLTRHVNALTWRLQAQVVAVSEEVALSIEEHLGDRVPVQVVRNGIEVGKARSSTNQRRALRRRLGIADGVPVVGTVAVFRTQKRLDLWLDAARRVLSAYPEARFVLVGDGPLAEELQATAERLGIASAVRFPGLQSEVVPYLSLFDIFLMSSQFEGLPLALLEAMALGVTPVATRVGGIPEVIDSGTDGVLVAPGDPAAMASEVAGLLADTPRRHALGQAARRKVHRDFSVRRMSHELSAIYTELAGA